MCKDKILFHYCSNYVLDSILKNKQLWMCDIANSNDYNEIRLFIPNLFYAIEDIYQEAPFPFQYNNLHDLYAIRFLLSKVSMYIDKVYDCGVLTSFVVCFCEEGDVLSQWRGYSDDGRGCSLGFSKKELGEYCASMNGIIRLEKVKYINEDELKSIIHDNAKEIIDQIKVLRTKSESSFKEREKITEEIVEGLMLVFLLEEVKKIMIDSLKYKWETFHEELEWRMFFNSISKDEDIIFGAGNNKELLNEFDFDAQILVDQLDFVVNRDNIISYYPINLMKISSNPVKKVYIGPKNKSRKQDLRLMLVKHEVRDADIEYSKISYC